MTTRRPVPILWTVFFVLAAVGFVFGMWSLTQRDVSSLFQGDEEEPGEEMSDQTTVADGEYICIRGSNSGDRFAVSCSTLDGEEVARIEMVQNNPTLNPETIDAVAFIWLEDPNTQIAIPKFWTDTEPLSCTINSVTGVERNLMASITCFTGDPNDPTEKRTYTVSFGDAEPQQELVCKTRQLSREGDGPVVTRSMTECIYYNWPQ